MLSEPEAFALMNTLEQRPMMAGDAQVRMSGAGAQNKLMVAFVDGHLAIPTGTTPSTHIIKPPNPRFTNLVANEFFCMTLAKRVGLPVPNCEILWIQSMPCYVVTRYDRRNENQQTVRLHQEDFCQALHIPPEMKYEDEGGPSLSRCFALLQDRISHGAMAGRDRLTLLQGIIFNFLIGNGDAHAKNFSLLYDDRGESLAPFYDLLSTLVYGNRFKDKMAMKLGSESKFRNVSRKRWRELGPTIGFRSDFVLQQLDRLSRKAEAISTTLAEELNATPNTRSPIYKKIVGGIGLSCKSMMA